jgi:hypothetical protein
LLSRFSGHHGDLWPGSYSSDLFGFYTFLYDSDVSSVVVTEPGPGTQHPD